MRSRFGPVAPVLLEGGHPAWLVLGYRELHFLTSNPALFGRDSRRWSRWPQVPDDWPLRPYLAYQPSVFYAEGDEHRRRSNVVHDVLAAVDQLQLRAQCERIADGLIDAFSQRGEADLATEYADVIPLFVTAALFGLDQNDTANLVRDLTYAASSDEGAVDATGRLSDLVLRLVQRSRERPGKDVPSRMIAHPARLTEEEIAIDLFWIITGSQLPTAYWISNTLRLLLVDDRFSLTLSGGRWSVGQAMEEVVWEDPPVQNFPARWAVRTTELGGQRIQAGDMLLLGLAGANADRTVHMAANQSGVRNRSHMSFGHGEYRCPGPAQEIAEVVARTAVEVLLDRLPDVTLAVDADSLPWVPSPWLRGLTALPVVFTAS
jgi:cytochrome P450